MVRSPLPGPPCEQIVSVQKSMKEWNVVLESHTGFVLLCTSVCAWGGVCCVWGVWGVWGVDVGCVLCVECGCVRGVWDVGCLGV